MKKYIKTERANLFEPNVYISMVVSMEGSVTETEIRNAVKNAYANHEATMAKVVLQGNGEAFYEKMNQSGCKIFADTRDWKEILKESEKKPFLIQKGEFVRTYIIKNGDRFQLFMMAHHLVGDGKSILILVEDILNSLNGKEISFQQMELVEEKSLEEKAPLPLVVKLFVKSKNRKWKKQEIFFSWDDYFKVHKSYWEKHSSQIRIQSYDLKELKEKCPKGVTLNSYMITKLLQEEAETERMETETEQGKVETERMESGQTSGKLFCGKACGRQRIVGVPVSIRENSRTIANQTSGIAMKYRYRTEKSFEANLKEVHQKLQEKLQNPSQKYFVLLFMAKILPTLTDAVLLTTHGIFYTRLSEKMAHIMGYKGKETRDLGVTNLMQINIPCEYPSFKVCDIIFIPPKISYAKKVVGISTYGDKMTVSYHEMAECDSIDKSGDGRES